MELDNSELIFENIKFKDFQEKVDAFKATSSLKAVKKIDVSFDEWFSTMYLDNLLEKSLIPLLVQFTDLEVLRIDMGTGFAGKKMNSLCKLLETYQKLKEIRLELSYFTGNEEFVQLADTLTTLKNLTSITIRIRWNNIAKKAIEDAFQRLNKVPALKELNIELSGNYHLLENQDFTAKEITSLFDKLFSHLASRKCGIELTDEDEENDG